MLVAAMLLLGLLGLAVPLDGLGLRNWLIILFQINAGAGQVPADPLRVFNPLDVAILVLGGVAFIGLGCSLGRVRRLWMAIGAALPFVGIGVLLFTGQAGRSSLMGGGLVSASLMVKGGRLGWSVAYLGILANALLLAGDFATGTSVSPLAAGVVTAGYVLLLVWFTLVGVKFIKRG